jgi:hypothetical protein
MSNISLINEINIRYLVNNSLFNKKQNPDFHEDVCFYQKRILNLTQDLITKYENKNTKSELILDETKEILPFDVMYTYEQYIKSCIHHFKTKDNNDILQENYKEYDDEFCEQNTIKDTIKDNLGLYEPNNLLMRSFSLSKKNLNSFVLKKKIFPENEIILPQNKNVDLKDPLLKTKGIDIQKNCENKYIDNINDNQNEHKNDNEIEDKKENDNEDKKDNENEDKRDNKKGKNKKKITKKRVVIIE